MIRDPLTVSMMTLMSRAVAVTKTTKNSSLGLLNLRRHELDIAPNS
jgi:hypothetical protein